MPVPGEEGGGLIQGRCNQILEACPVRGGNIKEACPGVVLVMYIVQGEGG